ncbi:MAG: flagellin [Christensenellaceae bacterium]|nr:flagellin [Christensenellaceae bacterium]MEA5067875.1 flagellin [Christensenellaceae bacterium]
MRISHNLTAMNTYRQYNTNTVNTNKSMEKLSSGARINRAADDAAGLSISEKMRSQIRGLTQATRNAQDGISFIQTAEGALNEVSDMLVRLKELATQAPNGTYSDKDQENIGAEMKSLGNAISDIYSKTKFNGIHVFGSANSAGLTTSHDGAGVAATIKYGEDGAQEVEIKSAKTTDLSALFALTSAAGATAASVTGVTDDAVEDAITEVNKTRADYGAQQNQLEHASNNMAATKENLQAAESRVRDVDMADEMMTYTKNNILLQAAQAMLAQANSQPQGILQLLQ